MTAAIEEDQPHYHDIDNIGEFTIIRETIALVALITSSKRKVYLPQIVQCRELLHEMQQLKVE